MNKKEIEQIIQWDKKTDKVIINGVNINDEEDLEKAIEELLFEISKEYEKGVRDGYKECKQRVINKEII